MTPTQQTESATLQMNTWAVILAAGRGLRAGRHLPKQFLPYRGLPLFMHSLLTFARIPALRGLVLVLPPDCDREALSVRLGDEYSLGLPCLLCAGGERRQDSSALGIAALPADCGAVLIHDAARPFVSPALITRVLRAVEQGHRAVIPGIPVTDTLKEVDGPLRDSLNTRGLAVADTLEHFKIENAQAAYARSAAARETCFRRQAPEEASQNHYALKETDGPCMVRKSIERDSLRAVQTPQGFVLADLKKALEHARAASCPVTDDAGLMELCGIPVTVVPGEVGNLKITTPEDLHLLRRTPDNAGCGPASGCLPALTPRSGFGYDVHRYGGKRPLILGGVPIPGGISVDAHSDGDVLLHALMDALLGCICGGDIGLLFPDTDPEFENIAGGILLNEVLERCRSAAFRPEHADLTVIAQVPRIAPHRDAITANIAKLLRLDRSRVNLKATTEEKMGFTGEKKGIKAVALVNGVIEFFPAERVAL